MLAEEILIVNDGSLLLKMMGGLLQNKGYQISLTDSPEEALMWLSTRHIVLVVMKLNGQPNDRLAVTHMVKELNGGAKLIILGEAAHLPAEIFEVGADDYVLLPCRAAELWRRLLSSLEAEPSTAGPIPAAPLPERGDDQVHPINRRLLNNLGLMFHDVRGHLTSIDESLKILGHKSDGRFDQDLENIFQEISQKSRFLIRMAEEFLEKFQGRPQIASSSNLLDLREDLVGPILEELRHDLQRKRIDLDNRLSLLPPAQQAVRGDRATLKSIFRNLLGNAINHGGYGCSICLEVDEAPTHFHLRVHNSGDPLAPLSQPQRVPGQTVDRGNGQGLGLGLALGREVMQSQGGDILFESCQQGAQFIMTLPRA